MANERKGLAAWLTRFSKKKQPQIDSLWSAQNEDADESAQSVRIGRQHLVFGLSWQLYADHKELRQLKRTWQPRGYTHYVVATSDDMVGFAARIDKNMGPKPVSAAIHLAETVALGGLEVFIFELPDGLYTLNALNDSQPVPHFDHIGTLQETLALVSEYRALQADQAVRFVGNTELFENIEKISLTEVFSRPDQAAHLHTLPNFGLRKLLALILIPSVLLFAGIAAWFEHARQVEEQERLARERDPNYIYEKAVGPAMQTIEPQAQVTLEHWREVVYRMPTARAGWRLEKVECQPSSCNATWQRDFGNYEDFKLAPLEGVVSSSEAQTGESPAKASITTVMGVAVLPTEIQPLLRTSLPGARTLLQEFGSQLQDISLLQGVDIKLKQPELYPATGATVDQITNPVVRGEWSITHDLWTLGELTFDLPSVALKGLTLQQDEKTKNWTYTLTGHYYANGKKN